MTYSDDITAPDQAIGSDDDVFESAELYSDDEYDIEYDEADEDYEPDGNESYHEEQDGAW